MWYLGLTRSSFLILSLFIIRVRCQFKTCGTHFTDVESSAYLADVIIEARVSSHRIALRDNKFNLTLSLRNILKGDSLLSDVSRINKEIVVGVFSRKQDEAKCIAKLNPSSGRKKYIFFLKSDGATTDNVYGISAFPVRRRSSVVNAIRSIVTRRLAKAPSIRKLKDANVIVGKKVTLRCDIPKKLKPPATIRWLFNSKPLRKRRGLKISEYKPRRRGSKVRIRRAKVDFAGEYTCVAENAVGEARKTVVLTVVQSIEKPNVTVKETHYAIEKGARLVLHCSFSGEATELVWLHNTKALNASDPRYGGGNKRVPSLEILEVNDSDSGMYMCQAKNAAGRTNSEPIIVSVQRSKQTRCGDVHPGFCFNGGTCYYLIDIGPKKPFCLCTDEYTGKRCELGNIYGMLEAYKSQMKLEKDRTLIIIGIVIAILVIIAICISSYFLAKKRREQFYKRREERKRLANDIPKELLNELEGKARAPFVPRKPTKTLGIQTLESCLTTNGQIHHNGEGEQDIPNNRPKLRERLHAVSLDKGKNGGPARQKPSELKKRRSCPEPARLAGNLSIDIEDFLPPARDAPKKKKVPTATLR